MFAHMLLALTCGLLLCRLVWNRIWAVLSDFFIDVGCHRNLQVRGGCGLQGQGPGCILLAPGGYP